MGGLVQNDAPQVCHFGVVNTCLKDLDSQSGYLCQQSGVHVDFLEPGAR